eukprot:scaffold4870_cov75-Skeletonema_dohrnii-CCMP3373.AAC.6
MSADNIVAEARMMCCASCGIAELDNIKLIECDACDLVRYCSDECKEDHGTEHEHACKKRAAELRDEKLFKQPESSHLGDCPICCLPHPLLHSETFMIMMSCCSKLICRGCDYANKLRERDARLHRTCPFCRHPLPKTDEETRKNTMRRVAANDRVAIHKEGSKHLSNKDYESAFDYFTKAAGLGDAMSHYLLALLYRMGKGVEKDEKKELFHLVEAAIAGHPNARRDLACLEGRNKRFDRAVKHFIIAANLGYDKAIQGLKKCYKDGLVSKEDFAAALRGHQAAVDATKSPHRDAAEATEKIRAYQQQTFDGNA